MAAGQSLSADYLAYIEQYRETAVRQQQEYGIPASITLAQGLLESGAGQSRFATEGNNHFGIKCHNTWKGDGIYMDDDEKGECFRKYGNAAESFEDHARFLKRKRYEPLFSLDVTDYKGWANGLKKCGYATDKRYADKLIELIETYELYKFDTGQPIIATPKHLEGDESLEHSIDSDIYNEIVSTHDIVKRNGLYCVIAKEGDTYAAIAKEFSIRRRKLLSFNDLGWRDRNVQLQSGDIIYLEEKHETATSSSPDTYKTKTGDSTYSIAQQFGIKLKSLCKINNLSTRNSKHPVKKGTKIRLR